MAEAVSPAGPRLAVSAVAWITSLAATAAVLLRWLWEQSAPLEARLPWTGLAMCAALVAAEVLSRRLVTSPGTPDSWPVFGPAVLAIAGVLPVLIASALSYVLLHVAEERPAYKLVFNLSVRVVTVVAVATVLAWGAGGWPPVSGATVETAPGVAALLAGTAVWWMIPYVSVSVVVSLAVGSPVQHELVRWLAADVKSLLPFIAASALIMLTFERQPLLLPLLLTPLAAVIASANRAEVERQEARTDALTGLPNRAGFLEELEEAVVGGRRFAVCIADLDGFKPVNDTFGHQAGDEVLRVLGGRLDAFAVGERTTIARLGGDEFAVLWRDDLPAPEYEARANEMLRRISAPIGLDQAAVAVSASMGVATSPEAGAAAIDLMAAADKAMYRAKLTGAPVVLSDRCEPR